MFRDSQHGYKNNVNRNIRMYCMYICTTNIHLYCCCVWRRVSVTYFYVLCICVFCFCLYLFGLCFCLVFHTPRSVVVCMVNSKNLQLLLHIFTYASAETVLLGALAAATRIK